MPKSRTDYRKERRTLLKEVFDKLFIIQSFNETQLEKISRQFFINLQMDLDEVIKRITYGDRYITGTHIYTNSHDDTANTGDKS
jgi:hypothetical protein